MVLLLRTVGRKTIRRIGRGEGVWSYRVFSIPPAFLHILLSESLVTLVDIPTRHARLYNIAYGKVVVNGSHTILYRLYSKFYKSTIWMMTGFQGWLRFYSSMLNCVERTLLWSRRRSMSQCRGSFDGSQEPDIRSNQQSSTSPWIPGLEHSIALR